MNVHTTHRTCNGNVINVTDLVEINASLLITHRYFIPKRIFLNDDIFWIIILFVVHSHYINIVLAVIYYVTCIIDI